jgi:hypothetical protein
MKKFFALPLAALFVAACAEPTSLANHDSPDIRAGKVLPPPGELSSYDVRDQFSFNSDFDAAAASWSGSGTSVSGINTSNYGIPIESKPAALSDRFVGRLDNYELELNASSLNSGGRYSLAFDLYIIGSWDGLGKQAQQGRFGADIWALSYRCGSETATHLLYETSFSNQKTVQQSYPLQYGQPGGNKAGQGREGENDLGYTAEQVHVPQFTSFTNTNYRMVFVGTNQCPSGEMTFVMTVPNALQPGNRDEAWGIDNVDLRVDN